MPFALVPSDRLPTIAVVLRMFGSLVSPRDGPLEEETHGRGGCIPRSLRQHAPHPLDARLVLVGGSRQRLLAGGTEVRGVAAEMHDLAVRLGNIGNRRADDRLLRRHVFE